MDFGNKQFPWSDVYKTIFEHICRRSNTFTRIIRTLNYFDTGCTHCNRCHRQWYRWPFRLGESAGTCAWYASGSCVRYQWCGKDWCFSRCEPPRRRRGLVPPEGQRSRRANTGHRPARWSRTVGVGTPAAETRVWQSTLPLETLPASPGEETP